VRVTVYRFLNAFNGIYWVPGITKLSEPVLFVHLSNDMNSLTTNLKKSNPENIGVGAKFRGCEGFLPEFSRTRTKSFVRLLPTNFLPQKSWRPFFGIASKNQTSLCVFLQNLEAYSSRIFRNFAQIFRNFPQIKTFGDALAPPPPETQDYSRKLETKSHCKKSCNWQFTQHGL